MICEAKSPCAKTAEEKIVADMKGKKKRILQFRFFTGRLDVNLTLTALSGHNEIMRHLACFIFGHILLISLWVCPTSAQTKPLNTYYSEADSELNVKSVVIAPFSDNVSGIYSKPGFEEATSMLEKDLRWSLLPLPKGDFGNPDSYELHPESVQKLLKAAKADAVITGRFSKGPAGLGIKLTLFVGRAGLPFAVEERTDASLYETKALRDEVNASIRRLRDRLPYQGMIASRKGGAVTVNIGKNSGVRDGDELSAIQILKVQRHPKLHFMVGVEKEILGKLRVTKADDELSFAVIVSEKDAGLLTSGMKIEQKKMVVYNEPVVGQNGDVVQEMQDRKDRPVAFGEKPVEWLPEHAPQFGRVQVQVGFSQYETTASLVTGGAISGANNFVPTIGLSGEAWITKDWFVAAMLRQTSFSVSNDLAGSSPSKLNASTSKYEVSFGHTFLLGDDFMGPKMQVSLGLGKFSSRIDESSPVAFSNMEYGGMNLGFKFATPIDPQMPWDVGAALRYYWDPGVSESVSSGSTKSVNVSDFAFTMGYQVRQNFRYGGELGMEYYSSDFSAGGVRPATGISHKVTSILFNIEYLF